MKIISDFKVRGFVLAAAFSASLGFGTSASAQVGYSIQPGGHSYLIELNSKTVTDIGTLGGTGPSSFTVARRINDAGQVVGSSLTAGGATHAFITGPNGIGIRDLETLGGTSSNAYGINSAGRVVGSSYTAGGDQHAFITGANGMGMRDLGTLPGDNISDAHGINDAGQVVGNSYTAGGLRHAFITGPNGMGMTYIGTLGGTGDSDYSWASGINNAGQVVGYSYTAGGGAPHAFITGPNGMGMRDLGTVGSYPSLATGVNDAGQVVGFFATRIGNHAFITGPDGAGMRDLGTLSGASPSYTSFADGINDAGQAVGSVSVRIPAGFSVLHAFVTGTNGTGMIDLNSLVSVPSVVGLTEATGINNAGQVIAILIPEPETSALFLAGLALVGFMALRKNMRAAAFSHR